MNLEEFIEKKIEKIWVMDKPSLTRQVMNIAEILMRDTAKATIEAMRPTGLVMTIEEFDRKAKEFLREGKK